MALVSLFFFLLTYTPYFSWVCYYCSGILAALRYLVCNQLCGRKKNTAIVRFCSGFRDGTLVLAEEEEGRDIITRTEKKKD